MKPQRPIDFVIGQWVHAFEEDREGERSYRRQGASVPRSRRPREILAFHADGRFEKLVPGPADAPLAVSGTWNAQSDAVDVSLSGGAGSESWTIVRADEGKLVLRKTQDPTPDR